MFIVVKELVIKLSSARVTGNGKEIKEEDKKE